MGLRTLHPPQGMHTIFSNKSSWSTKALWCTSLLDATKYRLMWRESLRFTKKPPRLLRFIISHTYMYFLSSCFSLVIVVLFLTWNNYLFSGWIKKMKFLLDPATSCIFWFCQTFGKLRNWILGRSYTFLYFCKWFSKGNPVLS